MAFPRTFHLVTLLPDGNVLVTGGGPTSAAADIANGQLTAEMWSPTTETWTTLARMKLERQDWVGAEEIADIIRRVGTQTSIADQINAAALVGQKKFDESLNLLQNAWKYSGARSQAYRMGVCT